jgi:hypothetical protein
VDVDGGFCYGLTEEGYKTAEKIELREGDDGII